MPIEPAWHVLDCDDKARWVPEDHRAVLMADAIWAPLLVDGPPACDFASTLLVDGARGDVKGKGGRSVTAKAKVAKGTKPKYCWELCDWKGQNLNRHYDKDHPTEVKSGAVVRPITDEVTSVGRDAQACNDVAEVEAGVPVSK